MSKPLLPLEIQERIVKNVSADSQTLRTLSLVSRAWAAFAREQLSPVVTIARRADLDDVLHLLPAAKWLTDGLRSVTISLVDVDSGGTTITSLESVVITILTRLPMLNIWTIHNGHTESASQWLSIHLSTISRIRSLSYHVRELHIHHLSLSTCREFGRLLSAFHHVSKLTCSSIRLRSEHQPHEWGNQLLIVRLHWMRALEVHDVAVDTAVMSMGLSNLELDTLALTLDEGMGGERIVNLLLACKIDFPALRTLRLSVGCNAIEGPSSIARGLTMLHRFFAHVSCPSLWRLSINLMSSGIYRAGFYLTRYSLVALMCHKLDQALGELPLHSVTIMLPDTTGIHCRATLRHVFPLLHERGILEIEYKELTSVNDSSHRTHDSRITCLTTSPCGRWAASGSADTSIVLWDRLSQGVMQEWAAHDCPVASLTFSSDSRQLLSASTSGHVAVWDYSTGRRTSFAPDLRSAIQCTSWSPDGAIIACGTDLGSIHVWRAFTHKLLYIFKSHERAVRAMQVSTDGRWLVSCGRDHQCRVWALTSGDSYLSFPGERNTNRSYESATVDKQSARLAVATSLGEVEVWDLYLKQRIATLDTIRERVLDMRFSADGCRVHLVYGARYEVCDASTGAQMMAWYIHGGRLRAARISCDEGKLVTFSCGRISRLWDTESWHCRAVVAVDSKDRRSCFYITPECTVVWIGTESGNVCVLPMADT